MAIDETDVETVVPGQHEQVAWLSPQMPQIRLVMKWASRGSLPFMKML